MIPFNFFFLKLDENLKKSGGKYGSLIDFCLVFFFLFNLWVVVFFFVCGKGKKDESRK